VYRVVVVVVVVIVVVFDQTRDIHTSTLVEGSTRGWGVYLHNTLQIQETKVYAHGGFRTRNSNSRPTADLRVRLHSQRVRV
jgi:hypothetical protein